MAISFVGSAVGTGTATMPAHQPGDMILVYAFRNNSTGVPTKPDGWTTLHGSTGANNCADHLVGKFATSSSETVGTWPESPSPRLAVHVYRGTTATGALNSGAGNGTNVVYPSLSLQDASGSSWVVRFAGLTFWTTSSAPTTPSGYTPRTVSQTVRSYDRAAVAFNPGSTSMFTDAGASGYQSISLELRVGETSPNPVDTTRFFQFF